MTIIFLSTLKSVGKQATETLITLSQKETSSFLLPVASISGMLFMYGLHYVYIYTYVYIISAFLMSTGSSNGKLTFDHNKTQQGLLRSRSLAACANAGAGRTPTDLWLWPISYPWGAATAPDLALDGFVTVKIGLQHRQSRAVAILMSQIFDTQG